jgi:hypothetical protein
MHRSFPSKGNLKIRMDDVINLSKSSSSFAPASLHLSACSAYLSCPDLIHIAQRSVALMLRRLNQPLSQCTCVANSLTALCAMVAALKNRPDPPEYMTRHLIGRIYPIVYGIRHGESIGQSLQSKYFVPSYRPQLRVCNLSVMHYKPS